jgi:hypothetical protein
VFHFRIFSLAYSFFKYKSSNLLGGHVIMLGAGNEEAATLALATYPGGLQVCVKWHLVDIEFLHSWLLQVYHLLVVRQCIL